MLNNLLLNVKIKMFKFDDVQSLVDDADFHLMSETIETINKLER